MFKTLMGSVWIAAAIAGIILGLNGSIEPAAKVIFSLVALAVLYAFALWTVMVNTRDPQPQVFNRNESK
jgi:hypothetical protein